MNLDSSFSMDGALVGVQSFKPYLHIAGDAFRTWNMVSWADI
jgi:hypothetical protein